MERSLRYDLGTTPLIEDRAFKNWQNLNFEKMELRFLYFEGLIWKRKHQKMRLWCVVNFLGDGKKTSNYKTYARNTNSNLSSVMQCFDGLVKCFKNVSNIKPLYTILYVIHKERKFTVNEDTDDHHKYIKYLPLFNLRLFRVSF